MKLYLVKCEGGKRYAGSAAQVREKKVELMAAHDVKKAAITVEDVEIKTSKPELLETLNTLCKENE